MDSATDASRMSKGCNLQMLERVQGSSHLQSSCDDDDSMVEVQPFRQDSCNFLFAKSRPLSLSCCSKSHNYQHQVGERLQMLL